MDKKLLYVVVTSMAILHNGKRYEKGSKLELTESEAENLSLYIELDHQSETEKQAAERKAAEEKAEKERLAAEQAQKEAEAKAKADAEGKAKESAKTKEK